MNIRAAAVRPTPNVVNCSAILSARFRRAEEVLAPCFLLFLEEELGVAKPRSASQPIAAWRQASAGHVRLAGLRVTAISPRPEPARMVVVTVLVRPLITATLW